MTEAVLPSETELSTRVVEAINVGKDALGLTTPEFVDRYNLLAAPEDRFERTTMNNVLAGRRKAIHLGEFLVCCRTLHLDPLDVVPELAGGDAASTRAKYRRQLIDELEAAE